MPKLYETPLVGKVIVRVDLLRCLDTVWGTDCQIYRKLLYKIVSGSCTEEEHRQLFASYYRKYNKITNYVNNQYHYGETNVDIIVRTIGPIRELINEHWIKVSTELSNAGGKFLCTTHDYIYFVFKPGVTIPDMNGVKIIC